MAYSVSVTWGDQQVTKATQTLICWAPKFSLFALHQGLANYKSSPPPVFYTTYNSILVFTFLNSMLV